MSDPSSDHLVESIDEEMEYLAGLWMMPNDNSRSEFDKIRDQFDALPICSETIFTLDRCIEPDPRQPFVTFVLGKMFIRCCRHRGDDRDELIVHMLTKYNLHERATVGECYYRLTPVIRRMLDNERYEAILFELVDHPKTDHQFAILENIMISQTMLGVRQEGEFWGRSIDYLREKVAYLVSNISDERCELVLRNWSYGTVQTPNARKDLLQIHPSYFAHLRTGATDAQVEIAPEWSKGSLLVALLDNILLSSSKLPGTPIRYSGFRFALVERLAEYPQNYQQLASMPWGNIPSTMSEIITRYEQGSIIMNTDGLFSLAWAELASSYEIMRIDTMACNWIRTNCHKMLNRFSSNAQDLAFVLQTLTACPCHCRDRRHPTKKPLHGGPLPIDQRDHALLATMIDYYRTHSMMIECLEVLAAYTREHEMPVHYLIGNMILIIHRPAATLAEMDPKVLQIVTSPDRHHLTITYERRSMTGVSITDAELTRDQIVDAYLSLRKKSAGSA